VHATEPGGILEWVLLAISAVVAIVGIVVAQYMYLVAPDLPGHLSKRYAPLYKLLSNKYYVDELYGFLFVRPFQRLAHFLDTVVDAVVLHDLLFVRPFQGLASFLADVFELEVIGGIVNGIAALVNGSSRTLRRVQTGYVRNYALAILFGVVAIVAYLLLR
jgi:NADH-quinone oxidoreductase subunit L